MTLQTGFVSQSPWWTVRGETKPRRVGMAVVSCLMSLGALTGCGGGDEVDTDEWIDSTGTDLVDSLPATLQFIPNKDTPPNPPGCKELDEWIEEAEDAPSPSDDELASAWRDLVDAATEVSAQCHKGDSEGVLTAMQDLSDELGDLKAVSKQL